MSTKVGSIDLELLLNSKQYNKQLKNVNKIANNTSNMVSSSLSKIGMAAIAAFSVKKIFDFGKECVNLGSDLAEVQNVVDVSFATMNESVNKFAQNAIEQFGLGQTVTKRYMGTFGAMSKSFGFAEKDAFEMSKTLTGLAGDVASFYNLSSDEAYTKLKSVFTGETETLKDLGVVMTQSALDQYALANGYGKTTAKMSEQEKVALRYKFVTEQLSSASGDFIRTQDSWANQTRVLTLRFNEFKATIGQGLINLFTPIIKGINLLLSKLQVLANAFKSFTEMIFGNAGGSNNSDTVANLTSNATDASEAVSGIGNSAKKTAKDLKSLASFDTAQILKSDKDDDTTSSGVSGAGGIQTNNLDLTGNAKQQVAELNSIFGGLNFEPLSKSLNNLKEAIKSLTQTLWSGLKWGYDEILVPLAKWTISDLLPAFFNMLAGALKVVNPILVSFGNIFKPIWDNLLKPLLSWTGGVIVATLNGVADSLSKVGNWMSNNQPIVDKIVGSLLTFFGLWKVTQLMAFIQTSGGVISAITKMTGAIWSNITAKVADKADTVALTLMYAKDFLVSMASATASIIKQTTQWVASTAAKVANTAATVAYNVAVGLATAATWLFNAALAVLTSPITLVIAAIAALVAGIYLLVKNWDKVKEAGAKAWDFIKNAWNSAGEWFNSTIIQPISNFFSNMWQGLTNGASTAWSSIKNVFGNVVNWFKDVFSRAWTAVKNVFSTGGRIFDGIKDGIANTFKNIVNKIISGINRVVSIPFNAINSALNGIRNLSVAGVTPFTWLPRISVPQIPMLAEGGYFKANQPTLAIVGDNKRQSEIVSPVGKIEEAVENVLNKRGFGNNQELVELLKTIIILLQSLGLDFNLYIDGYELEKRLEKIRNKNKFATNGG